MYEESSCFDPNPTVEAIVDDFCESPAVDTAFPVSHQYQPPILVAGSTTNSFNDELKLPTMDEFSVFPSVISFPNSETQNQISNNNNNHLIQQMIHDSNWAVSTDNSGFFMNTSDPNTTTTPIPDLLSLLHLPRCSVSLPSSNLSDIMSGSCFTYDPLFHLNLPPQPPLIPPNDYSGFLLGIDHTNSTQRDQTNVGDENNNGQFDSGIIEFSKEIRRKGRGKQKNKPFTTERERRCHLNERYEALKLLIPSPSKIGEHYSFLLNTKLNEGSTIYASAIANRVIEVVDKHYMAALPINNYELLG
ncbi:unnamed protein product [Thlaspi arvense]|uniref:BHLH domain-containing protein n=1 Tax=Thlaspi arvense TaxID=13288 RepID=A0AAU9SBJ2_THLAR|nr:unnamed protein product [Thlaspi arvense]